MHNEQRQWQKTYTIVPSQIFFHKELIIWQNRFEWFLYFRSNLFARLSWIALGNSKQKNDWQHLTMSILPVWNSFIKNLFTTKSSEFKSVFLNGQASRPYSKIGIHLVNVSLLLCSGQRGATYFDQRVYVCLSVRANISKQHVQTSRKLHEPVTCARGLIPQQ